MMSCEMELAERIYFDSNKASHDLLNPGSKTSQNRDLWKFHCLKKKSNKQAGHAFNGCAIHSFLLLVFIFPRQYALCLKPP